MIHTPTLLLISLAINLMSALLMLFIHFLKPGRRNFLFWSLSAFLFSLSILLLSLGIRSGHPALGIRVGGLVSLMSILLLLAGFYALYGLSWRPRTLWGGAALLLLAYLGLSSHFEVRIVLALMESVVYLWCACLIVSLSRQWPRPASRFWRDSLAPCMKNSSATASLVSRANQTATWPSQGKKEARATTRINTEVKGSRRTSGLR